MGGVERGEKERKKEEIIEKADRQTDLLGHLTERERERERQERSSSSSSFLQWERKSGILEQNFSLHFLARVFAH